VWGVQSNWVHSALRPAPGDYDDGEIGGIIGKGKPAPVPLCPPQTPHTAQRRTRAAAVGSQRLTAWATAPPGFPPKSLLIVGAYAMYILKDLCFAFSLDVSDYLFLLLFEACVLFRNLPFNVTMQFLFIIIIIIIIRLR
jgi:hypothetical protein